jgi:hypothetical protein
MKQFVTISFLIPILSGCATFGQMEEGLNALMGNKIETAFDVLGYPSGKQEYGSDTLYIWGRNVSGGLVLPYTATTSGYVGSTSYYGTTTSMRWCRLVRQPEGVFKQRPAVIEVTGIRQPFSVAIL